MAPRRAAVAHELAAGRAARAAAAAIASAVLDTAHADTAEHCHDVGSIAAAICDEMGIAGRLREDVVTAAELHDVGKVALPGEVLCKPGPLSSAEWMVVRRHTIDGERILAVIPELSRPARFVRHSHERWDGDGYPDRLAGSEIPLGSRIVFCADAFHAISSDRPYRRARSAAVALAEIAAGAGTQFDPAVVAALRRALRRSQPRPASVETTAS